MFFPATRADALAQLRNFLPHAGRAYAANRNLDEGPGVRSHVSGLSPAIRRRLVTEEEAARAAIGAHGFVKAEKFIQEVCWRTYWRGWLEARPMVWHRYRAAVDQLRPQWVENGLLDDAIHGRTGIDCFDFWARELVETGFLHNHARMSFASIWIFTLRLPWQLGAAHFYQHLLDACPAANTLGWRWVAGLQTAGKTYLASAEAIRRTSMGRFSVTAPLARTADPVAAEAAVHPAALPALPVADATTSGLWVHSEDLSAETFPWPAPIGAIVATDGIGGTPAGPKRAYANAALDDGCARATAYFAAPASRLAEADLEAALPAWAQSHGITQLLTPYAPVGPVADRLARVGDALARSGIRLVRMRRPWDERAWPHATRGFFHFKAGLPALLAG